MNLLTALFGTRRVPPPPEVPSPNPRRGRLALAGRDEAPRRPRCIACGACARACPFGCITVEAPGRRESLPAAARAKVHVDRLVPSAPLTLPPSGPLRHEPAGFFLDLTQCCRCGLCVAACPTGAILFSRNLAPCTGPDCDEYDLLAEFRGPNPEPPTQRP